MVSVTHKFTPLSAQPGLDIQAWIDSLSKSFTPEEFAKIRHACEFAEPLYAGQMELTGVPLMQHALGTAAILGCFIFLTNCSNRLQLPPNRG